MNKITNQFASIEQVTDRYLNRKSTETAAAGKQCFFRGYIKTETDDRRKSGTSVFQTCTGTFE